MIKNGGLSPLARGTHRAAPCATRARRLIPAGAGNTLRKSGLLNPSPVYPRWRGEHLLRFAQCGPDPGLSPLARGTLYRSRATSLNCRFIPAGAGNTDGKWRPVEPGTVYPRWRGEHMNEANLKSDAGGLSPLARGTLVRIAEDEFDARFIPAGAGNTPG